jgi:hypothetical protein
MYKQCGQNLFGLESDSLGFFHHACPLDDILPILLFKLIDGASEFSFSS